MIVGRFAPSPTGRMHLGNVMCALLSWLSVKSRGGEALWRLRIEDLDPQRSRKEYALQLMDDLQWLGLPWDGEVVWQSLRYDIYEEFLNKLQNMGLTYYCNCTRADIMATQAPHEADGRVVYAGICRDKHLTAGAVRLRVPNDLQKHCGDFILRRKDGAWAYQLAVVVDDGQMGITQVVRGRDLLTSVPQQKYLYQLLDLKCPDFIHHPLLCNKYGQRLCKRDKTLDMGELRKSMSARQIIGRIAYLAGILPEEMPISPQELIPIFSWKKIPTQDIIINN